MAIEAARRGASSVSTGWGLAGRIELSVSTRGAEREGDAHVKEMGQ